MSQGPDIAELILKGRGAWPPTVWERPKKEDIDIDLGGDEPRSFHPDLSLIRGEWYFTPQTARELAAIGEGTTLLVGTPSLAIETPQATLVDSSPWASARFNLGQVNHLAIDFEDYWSDARYDRIYLDPPWYFPALINWIHNAAFLSNRDTKIMFPLFGEGTRPEANNDRLQILSECKKFGDVEIVPEAISYETPYFEQRALLECGFRIRGSWRRSDLAILTVIRPAHHLLSIREPSSWTERRIGDRIIAVRSGAAEIETNLDQTILPVPGVANWVLNTVSRRDSRWRYINVWCSDNRVGFTRDPEALLRAAEDISNIGLPDAGSLMRNNWLSGLLEWMEF